MRGKKTSECDIDLGLAISAASLPAGQTRSLKDIAAYCGCTYQQIANIEQKALRKLRNLHFNRNARMTELFDHYCAPTDRGINGRRNRIDMPIAAEVPDNPPPEHKRGPKPKLKEFIECLDQALCPATA